MNERLRQAAELLGSVMVDIEASDRSRREKSWYLSHIGTAKRGIGKVLDGAPDFKAAPYTGWGRSLGT